MSAQNAKRINLDQPGDLRDASVIPWWAKCEIEKNDGIQLYDIFPSKQDLFEAHQSGRKDLNRKIYPLTLFSLIQLLTAERNENYFSSREIRLRHKKWMSQYEDKCDKETYRVIFQQLISVGLIDTKEYGELKYGLPEGKSVAPTFDPANAKNRLDDIVFDSPTKKKEEYRNTWVPISLQPLEVNPKDALSGPFGTLWHSSWIFLATWFLLSVAWASRPWMETFDPTASIIVVFWALISVATAALVVDVLDQVRRGYQTSMQQ